MAAITNILITYQIYNMFSVSIRLGLHSILISLPSHFITATAKRTSARAGVLRVLFPGFVVRLLA